MRLGKQIRAERESRGWTLEQLSEKSGVEVGTISAIEVRNSMRSQHFPALADALGLTMNALVEAARASGTSDLPGKKIKAAGHSIGYPTADSVSAASVPLRDSDLNAAADAAARIARCLNSILHAFDIPSSVLGDPAAIRAKIIEAIRHKPQVLHALDTPARDTQNPARQSDDHGNALDLWAQIEAEKNKSPGGKPGDSKERNK